jgi:Skp family chaperone for outer membrane proteins
MDYFIMQSSGRRKLHGAGPEKGSGDDVQANLLHPSSKRPMTALFLLGLFLQLPAPPETPAAIVNVPRVVAESVVGKAVTARLQAFQSEKQRAIADRQATLKRLSDSRALQAQIDRAQVELQRFAEDAQVDVEALDRQVQLEFEKKLRPVLTKIVEEDHIGILFEYPQQLIVWVAPAIDITAKVIERLDAAEKQDKK